MSRQAHILTCGNTRKINLARKLGLDLEHHIEVPADERTGLKQVSYAMTEQVRAMSNERAGRQLGRVSDGAMTTISRYVHLFIV
ncbi:MAG: type II toxin-antitoxin system PemK/MazF family toxin [Streptosporangiaceae bacterium]